MKKLFVFVFLSMFIASPVLADIINPNIPMEEYSKMRENRRIYRERMSLITRVCGNDISDSKVCKSKLKKEMKEIEKLIK